MKTIFLRFLCRPLMKLAHRFNWHYAPRIGPMEDGATQLWCKWCGLRMNEPARRPGHKALRVVNGKFTTFDPNPLSR